MGQINRLLFHMMIFESKVFRETGGDYGETNDSPSGWESDL